MARDQGEDEDSETYDVTFPDKPERSDTRTIEDFLRRANRARKAEYRKNLMPIKGARNG